MFDFSNMNRTFLSLPEKIEKAVMGFGKTQAASLEAEAKKNRPWSDRTAQARQRITGYCEKTDVGVRIYLSHGVNYGVYLELANEKRYAIIYPTLRQNGPEIMRDFSHLIGGIK